MLLKYNRSERCKLAMGFMEFQQLVDIHVAHAVTVCEEKRFISDISLNPLDPAASHGVKPRIDNRNLPWFQMLVVNGDLIPLGKIKSYI